MDLENQLHPEMGLVKQAEPRHALKGLSGERKHPQCNFPNATKSTASQQTEKQPRLEEDLAFRLVPTSSLEIWTIHQAILSGIVHPKG
jgi:hypothetical protein